MNIGAGAYGRDYYRGKKAAYGEALDGREYMLRVYDLPR